MKEAAARLMEIEKPSRVKSDHEDLVRSFEHLNLKDGQLRYHNKMILYFMSETDEITQHKWGVAHRF